MSERERVEREQRLAEIRESVENRPPLNTLAYYGYAIRYFDEIPYLLAEVERLTAERDKFRAAVMKFARVCTYNSTGNPNAPVLRCELCYESEDQSGVIKHGPGCPFVLLNKEAPDGE